MTTARWNRSWSQTEAVGTDVVVVTGATVVLVEVLVVGLVVVEVEVEVEVEVDELVVVGGSVVDVEVDVDVDVEVEVEVDVDVDVEVDDEVVDGSAWKLMWWAAERVSPPVVMVAKITHGVTTQLTTVPLVAVKVDITVKSTGTVAGSFGLFGAPIGLNSPLLPVVNRPRGDSQRVRSAVHCRRVPPTASAPKRRPVTWTTCPDTRLSLGVTNSWGSVKRGSGNGGRVGSYS